MDILECVHITFFICHRRNCDSPTMTNEKCNMNNGKCHGLLMAGRGAGREIGGGAPKTDPRPVKKLAPNTGPTPCPPRMFCAIERLIISLSSFDCQRLSRLTARSKSFRASAAKSGTMLPE